MRAERAHFQRRDRQFQIIDRAGRRSEMKNVIDLFFRQENEIGNVVLDELVIFVAGQMPNVRVAARDEIVDRDDAMTFRQQTVGQMRPQKTGATGDDGNGFGVFSAIRGRYLIPKERLGSASGCELPRE